MQRYYKRLTHLWPWPMMQPAEPGFQGTIVSRITDVDDGVHSMIFVVECDDSQDAINLTLRNVEKLAEDKAAKLAQLLQTPHKVTKSGFFGNKRLVALSASGRKKPSRK